MLPEAPNPATFQVRTTALTDTQEDAGPCGCAVMFQSLLQSRSQSLRMAGLQAQRDSAWYQGS
jgi:hypothetical protein